MVDAMAMGDLVLLETEINPVMTKLIENGIEITAVHNHLLRANPATFYMHSAAMVTRSKWQRRSAGLGGKQDAAGPHPRQRPRRLSISILHSLSKSSASKGKRMAASINLACRGATHRRS